MVAVRLSSAVAHVQKLRLWDDRLLEVEEYRDLLVEEVRTQVAGYLDAADHDQPDVVQDLQVMTERVSTSAEEVDTVRTAQQLVDTLGSSWKGQRGV